MTGDKYRFRKFPREFIIDRMRDNGRYVEDRTIDLVMRLRVIRGHVSFATGHHIHVTFIDKERRRKRRLVVPIELVVPVQQRVQQMDFHD